MRFKLEDYLKQMALERKARQIEKQKYENPKTKEDYFGPERRKKTT